MFQPAISTAGGYRNHDSYLPDAIVLSFNTMYLTHDDKRPQKD